MSLTLNTNVSALQTQQYLNINTTNTSTALQQLSSGNRLNSAADDPADYAIAYKLGVKSASLTTSINNGNQALSMLQVAQGGIQQIGNILTQLKQIATEAASSNTDSSDLPALQTQVNQLETEINNIASALSTAASPLLAGAAHLYSDRRGDGGRHRQHELRDARRGATAPLRYRHAGGALGAVTMTLVGPARPAQTVTVAIPAQGAQSTVNFSQLGISMQVNAALRPSVGAATDITVTAGSSSFQYPGRLREPELRPDRVGIVSLDFG